MCSNIGMSWPPKTCPNGCIHTYYLLTLLKIFIIIKVMFSWPPKVCGLLSKYIFPYRYIHSRMV